MNQACQRFKAKLLVVGPDASFHRHIQKTFLGKSIKIDLKSGTEMGYAVYWAKSFAETLISFGKIHPDLLLVSSQTPEITKLITHIRATEDQRHTGIIVCEDGDLHQQQLGSLEAFDLGVDDYIDQNKSLGETIARTAATIRLKIMTDELRQANHRLEVLSNTDDLTGLYNMRYFEKFYQNLLASRQSGHPAAFAIVMMDLDRFKSINDNTNHLVGSYIIGEVGKLLRLSRVFGPEACVARYGGDEYIVAMPCDSQAELSKKAESMRQLLDTAKFERDDFEITITASIGGCFVRPNFAGDDNDPIKAADLMLYKSKADGRNKVSLTALGDAIDFDHIRRDHFVHGEASGNNNGVPRFNYIKVLK